AITKNKHTPHPYTTHFQSLAAFQTTGSKKRTGFGPHPESEHPGQMRLECRSRTAISCDSHERREQHFRQPEEKADRIWSAPRKRTPRPDAAGMPIAHSHFL